MRSSSGIETSTFLACSALPQPTAPQTEVVWDVMSGQLVGNSTRFRGITLLRTSVTVYHSKGSNIAAGRNRHKRHAETHKYGVVML